MRENTVLVKTYAFSLATVKICRRVQQEQKEFVLTKQLLRSSTSIGANAEEAVGGVSSRDFSNKMSIAYKEAREAHYWLRLLRDTEIIEKNIAENLIKDCDEILRILYSIIKSTNKAEIN